ncbi:MAG: DUF3050 domain-containing protein [Fuerstiella sp.]
MHSHNGYQRLQESLAEARSDLIQHELYDQLQSLESMHIFMQHHVFAVWDFMSLLKSLQRELTCVAVPWRPAASPSACRLVNEIVLAEESDIDIDGRYASHFEIYLAAMVKAGADTRPMQALLSATAGDASWKDAIQKVPLPTAVRDFIGTTFDIIDNGQLCQIAAAFTFGREELLPDVFERIVVRLNSESAGRLDRFEYYLNRHIELDGDEHGEMAQRLMQELCGHDDGRWKAAESAARRSLAARKQLWDAMSAEIHRTSQVSAVDELSGCDRQ